MDIVSLPIIISKEGKWFVASCPLLDIATQGKTENEAKENMEDPDIEKPDLKAIVSLR
jgi:predicted RNase H-like HicB family nuclease